MNAEEMNRAIGSLVDREGFFTQDLNAMHEAEKWLQSKSEYLYGDYCDTLYDNGGYSATAEQRAKAFVEIIPLLKRG